MRKREHNYILIAACLVFTFVVSFCSIFYLNKQIRSRQEHEQKQNSAIELCRELIQQNNSLYYLNNSFVKSGDITFFENYWALTLDSPRFQLVSRMETFVTYEEEKKRYAKLQYYENVIQEYETIIMKLQIQEMKRRGLSEQLDRERANNYYRKYVENFSGKYVFIDPKKNALDYLSNETYLEALNQANEILEETMNIIQAYQLSTIAQTDRLARRTIILQFVSFLFVVLMAILLYRKNATMKELRNINERIVSAIGDGYEMIGVVDLSTYHFSIIKGNTRQWSNKGNELDYFDAQKYYLDHMVSAAYKDTYRRTIQPVNVLNKIENDLESASCVFKDTNGQWLIIEFTKSHQYTKDKPVVTVTIKNAWNIMKQRKEQRQKDEILMQFSQDFFEVYVVDLNRGSYQIIRSAQRFGNYVKNLSGSFEQLIELAIVSWAKPDFASFFEQIADVQNIKERFASGEKKIEFVYLSNDGKWKHLQCFPVPEYGEDNEKMIFALKDYNEEMQILSNEVFTREAINDIYSIAFVCEERSGIYRCLHVKDDIISFPAKGYYQELRELICTKLHTDDVAKYMEKTDFACLKSTNRTELEFRIQDQSGNYHYYREHIIKVNISSGERIIHFARNIDEEKANEILAAQQMEKELRTKAKELEMANLLAKKSIDLERALSEAERANVEKTKFLSNMSHDLRTPMNAILGMSQMAKKHLADSQRVERYLGAILSSADSMQGLINDILDVHKIEKGIISFNMASCELTEFLDMYEQVFRLKADEKNQVFSVDVRLQHTNVMLDTVRAKQVISNLTTNAMKYTSDGGTIFASFVEEESEVPGTSCYIFRVKDNGIGMSKEFVDRIYDRYERESNEYTEKVEGYGLGMSIVKNIVDLAKGTIEIESEPGVGTLVQVKVVLSHAKEEDCVQQQKQETLFPGKRILLVEDKRINAEIVKGFLEDSQIEIDVARNGQEAVEMVAKHDAGYYDLIFMDIRMPVMNGYESTRQIRALGKEDSASIPIIAMSANSLQEDIEQSLECGMNGHICKPIEMEEVFTCLNRWLVKENELV